MSLNREAPERQDIEALLPWHAAGTLSRRDSRSRRAGAGQRPRACPPLRTGSRRAQRDHPSQRNARCAVRSRDGEAVCRDRRGSAARQEERRSMSSAAWSNSCRASARARWPMAGTAAAVALLVQAAVLTTVVVQRPGRPSIELASAPTDGPQLAGIRFAPTRRSPM